MRNVNGKFIGIALGAAIFGLVVGPRAFASRCGEQNPPRCGLDSDPNPPDPAAGGCTETWLHQIPLYRGTGMCQPGYTPVIYDLSQPFPDNGLAADAELIGEKSFVTIKADEKSACANMVDTQAPYPCPNKLRCPNSSVQPPGSITAPI